MEVEYEQLQQARVLAATQQTAKQMAADLDKAWAAQQRGEEAAQEREDQVRVLGGVLKGDDQAPHAANGVKWRYDGAQGEAVQRKGPP